MKKTMYKALMLSLFISIIMACGKANVKTKTHSNGESEVIFDNGGSTNSYDLYEFTYKGHTYVSCKVRDGIALTHAGHCQCNQK